MKFSRITAILSLFLIALCALSSAAAEAPVFIPGDLDDADHEHVFAEEYLPAGDGEHEYRKYCIVCDLLLDSVFQEHTYTNGVCIQCGMKCAHSTWHKETYMNDGKPRREGMYMCYDGWDVTLCDHCGEELHREKVTVRKLHLLHTWRRISVAAGYGNEHLVSYRCEECGDLSSEREKHNGPATAPAVADGNPDTHYVSRKCTACHEMYEERAPHTPVLLSAKTDEAGGGHIETVKCTECGEVYEVSNAHTPVHISWQITDAGCTETVRCNICGLVYTLEPEEHRYGEERCYVSPGNKEIGTHTVCVSCVRCGYRKSLGIEEPHQFVNYNPREDGAVCKLCGQEQSHDYCSPDFHYPIGYAAVNDKQHVTVYLCFYCGNECNSSVYRDHHFDPVTMKCNECGYLAEGCDHDIDLISKAEGSGHITRGQCSKCGKLYEHYGAHEMSFICYTHYESDELRHVRQAVYTCSVCGLQEAHEEAEWHYTRLHEVSATEYTVNQKEHTRVVTYNCDVCGNFDLTETQQHMMETAVENDIYTHTGTCSACGYSGIASHAFIVTQEEGTCRYCASRHSHTDDGAEYLSVEYSSCNYMYHWCHVMCALCGREVRYYAKEHALDENGICPVCGYRKAGLRGTLNIPEQEGEGSDSLPGGENESAPCTLSAGGISLDFTVLEVLDDGNGRRALIITPMEQPDGETALTLALRGKDAETLQKQGVQAVYLYLNDTLIPAVTHVSSCLDAMRNASVTELFITFTPDASSFGGYSTAASIDIPVPDEDGNPA